VSDALVIVPLVLGMAAIPGYMLASAIMRQRRRRRQARERLPPELHGD
jgi:hypothetical protein